MHERKKLKHITIIGAGSWGTAVGKVIADNNPGREIRLWSYEKSTAGSINNRNINQEYLPGVKLPANMKATTNLREALENAMAVIIATPSKVLPDMAGRISKKMKTQVPIAYLTKGFCRYNHEILTISQTISKIMPDYKNRVVSIYGPSHAEEVVKNYHTSLNIAGKSEEDRSLFSNLLNCSYLQCRETEDIIGVDVGGTLKNPAAIAAGMISVLPECGDNLAGALMAESLKEMIALGTAMGGKIETIVDISGTGDLVATSLSEHSRNRRFGKDIATQIIDKGTSIGLTDKIYLRFKPEYVLEKMSRDLHYLAEGAYAIEPLIELAEKNDIAIPVYRSLYEVLLNKKDPSLLIETIKNPHKFDEIYNEVKIQVKDRQKGLEKVKGRAFKKIITQQVMSKYISTDNTGAEPAEELVKSLLNLENYDKEDAYIFSNDEKGLIKELTSRFNEKNLKKLIIVYLNEMIDQYSPFFNSLFRKYLRFLYLWNKIRRIKNSLISTGDFNRLLSLKDSANIIYVARYKNLSDYLYYISSIHQSGLPLPRFFVSDTSDLGRTAKFLIRKSGGFFISRQKFSNPLYRECVIRYLSAMVTHGVPVLYFPELEPEKDFNISPLSENFFHLLKEVLYQETREIVLVPVQITYKNKADETLVEPVFTEEVRVNFSSPLFLSDFTRQSQAPDSVSELIRNTWKEDEIILPQHVLCSLLSANGNYLKQHRLKKHTEKFMNENYISVNMSPRQIVNEGLKFLIENGIVRKKDDGYEGVDIPLIEKYSEIVRSSLSEK